MKKKRYIKKSKSIGVMVLILGVLGIHFYVPRIITEIRNPLIAFIKPNAIATATQRFQERPGNGKFITFTSFDQTELKAFLTYSKLDTVKGTVILLHGIRAYKEHFITLSQQLSEKGYHTVALDLRAHGGSGGQHCTFGVKEKRDVMELITVLLTEEQLHPNIGIWGQSLGGAVGLQTMGIDQRIKFGIIESTFTDFRTITNDYMNYHLGFTIKGFTSYLVNRAGKIADFDPNDAKPITYCKNIEQPILIVHGTKDKRIKIDYGRQNFEHINSRKKEFLAMKNANHLSVWKIGGEAYFKKVFQFIEKRSTK